MVAGPPARAAAQPYLAVGLVGVALLLLLVGAAVTGSGAPPEPGTLRRPEPYRAFTGNSYWNTPLEPDTPRHPRSAQIIDFLASTERRGCVQLSGAGNNWGMPVYWARAGDPEYAVASTGYRVPPEFGRLRIPRGARPHAGGDREMVVYDLQRGYVAFLHRAVYDPRRDRWTAGGGSVAYVGSNGLAAGVPGADDPRNGGSHRGLNGAVVAARYDEVWAGRIEHVLKIATATEAGGYHWPMSGTDGTATEARAPAQGLRLRIKPGVDLSTYQLHPQARVLARALQEYGAVFGDSTTRRVELKLEDTVAEGKGQLWEIGQHALCGIPVEAYEVVAPAVPVLHTDGGARTWRWDPSAAR